MESEFSNHRKRGRTLYKLKRFSRKALKMPVLWPSG